MAANIQKRDVQVGLEQAWHNLTKVVENINDDNAEILYDMGVAETYYTDATGKSQKSNGRQIFSLDDGLPIGRTVGSDYTLISNKEIWESLKKSLENVKHEIVSVGTVNDRSLGFASVKLQDNFVAANRETFGVLNFLWGHGGNRSVVAKNGYTVVVCQNTFNQSLKEKGDLSVSMRHTKNASLDDMAKVIDVHYATTEAFKAAMQEMESKPVNSLTARKIYAGFLNRSGKALDSKNTVTRLTASVDELENLFATGKGNRGENLADVFNGYTDLLTHGSGKNPWKSYVSSEFGANAEAKAEFYSVLMSPSRLADTVNAGESTLLELGI